MAYTEVCLPLLVKMKNVKKNSSKHLSTSLQKQMREKTHFHLFSKYQNICIIIVVQGHIIKVRVLGQYGVYMYGHYSVYQIQRNEKLEQ